MLMAIGFFLRKKCVICKYYYTETAKDSHQHLYKNIHGRLPISIDC